MGRSRALTAWPALSSELCSAAQTSVAMGGAVDLVAGQGAEVAAALGVEEVSGGDLALSGQQSSMSILSLGMEMWESGASRGGQSNIWL